MNAQHEEAVVAVEAQREANEAAKQVNEAEAKRLAQAKRELAADERFHSHHRPAYIERKRREKAEAELADYKRKAEPFIEAAQRREAELTERQAPWAQEDADDERLAKANEQEREREQAKKRGGALKELEWENGQDASAAPAAEAKGRRAVDLAGEVVTRLPGGGRHQSGEVWLRPNRPTTPPAASRRRDGAGLSSFLHRLSIGFHHAVNDCCLQCYSARALSPLAPTHTLEGDSRRPNGVQEPSFAWSPIRHPFRVRQR